MVLASAEVEALQHAAFRGALGQRSAAVSETYLMVRLGVLCGGFFISASQGRMH